MGEFVYRPWGGWEIIHVGNDKVVKKLIVNPGQMLSLQYHDLRSEHWFVVEGQGVVYTTDSPWVDTEPNATYLGPYRTYVVTKGLTHRLINPERKPLVIIETISGSYDESDIVRLHDNYERE